VVEVGITELRDHLSKWLKEVAEGETVVVTDRGRPVARLVGVGASAALDRLIREGLADPPTVPKGDDLPFTPVKPNGSVTELLLDQRGR
jgi:prevent-host-death family protein